MSTCSVKKGNNELTYKCYKQEEKEATPPVVVKEEEPAEPVVYVEAPLPTVNPWKKSVSPEPVPIPKKECVFFFINNTS